MSRTARRPGAIRAGSASSGTANRGPKDNPLACLDFGQLSQTRWQDLAIRFGFGALVSVAAGVIAMYFGERVGGLLLAFPAILPATLTLIEKEEGEKRSFHDLQGTVAGACGLVAFGVVGATTIGRLATPVALLASLLAWCIVAGILYLAWANWLRSRGVKL